MAKSMRAAGNEFGIGEGREELTGRAVGIVCVRPHGNLGRQRARQKRATDFPRIRGEAFDEAAVMEYFEHFRDIWWFVEKSTGNSCHPDFPDRAELRITHSSVVQM